MKKFFKMIFTGTVLFCIACYVIVLLGSCAIADFAEKTLSDENKVKCFSDNCVFNTNRNCTNKKFNPKKTGLNCPYFAPIIFG